MRLFVFGENTAERKHGLILSENFDERLDQECELSGETFPFTCGHWPSGKEYRGAPS